MERDRVADKLVIFRPTSEIGKDTSSGRRQP